MALSLAISLWLVTRPEDPRLGQRTLRTGALKAGDGSGYGDLRKCWWPGLA